MTNITLPKPTKSNNKSKLYEIKLVNNVWQAQFPDGIRTFRTGYECFVAVDGALYPQKPLESF